MGLRMGRFFCRLDMYEVLVVALIGLVNGVYALLVEVPIGFMVTANLFQWG